MSADFLDTSALAKHYHPEVGSSKIDRLWNQSGHGLFVSCLAVLEIVSVFAGKVRAGAISVADLELLHRRFFSDLTRSKRLTGVRLLVGHYQEAERLLRQHGPLRRLRTLDAIQLAVAIDLHRKKVIERIVSADRDLLAVAISEGIGVLDPENP